MLPLFQFVALSDRNVKTLISLFAVCYDVCYDISKDTEPILTQCWPTVCDAGPTLSQHQVNVSCLLTCCAVCKLLVSLHALSNYCFSGFLIHGIHVLLNSSPNVQKGAQIFVIFMIQLIVIFYTFSQ